MKIICDLDGTVCNNSHRLHYIRQDPPNWDAYNMACLNDPRIEPVCKLVKIMYTHGYEIHFFTGRSEIAKMHTTLWLDDVFPKMNYKLKMREFGDESPDVDLKAGMLKPYMLNGILFVLEDRDSVVKMYRKSGLRVLQVADGNF